MKNIVISKPDIINYWEWKGKKYRFDIYPADSFEGLENVTQVYALVLNDSKTHVLVVTGNNGMKLLPGGTVEKAETLLDTLVREVKEETNRDIKVETARPLFYQKAYHMDEKGEWVFASIQVRYSVEVDKDNEFVEDPDLGDVIAADWVPISTLEDYLDWGDTISFIKRLLAK